jgi:hypothetical protein
MTKTPINELAHNSAGLLFYWLFCPRCVFDIHIKSLGYAAVNFGQEVSCKCPNCEKIIVKKVGMDLGVIKDDQSDLRQDA